MALTLVHCAGICLSIFNTCSSGMIIPEDFEPPVRILRATIPGIESQSKFRILLLVDYLPRHYL